MAELQPGAIVSNTGISFDTVVVPETGDFRSAANEWRHYVAGARIPRSEAIAFGIVEAPVAVPVDIRPLTEAELGDQYARCLEAAGFVVYRKSDLIEATGDVHEFSPAEHGEQLAGWLKEAGYVLTKSEPEPQPQTAAEKDRADAAARRAAKAAAKAEDAPDNKAEPEPENKSE